MLLKDIGEVGIIKRISAYTQDEKENIIVGIGDDAAVVRTNPELASVYTTDILVENIHFSLSSISPFQLGYKSIMVNISDIAAMAANPRYALISLALDLNTDVKLVDEFYEGVIKAASSYGVVVIGGDLSKADTLIVSVVLIGEVEEGTIRRRNTASVGEKILVTGKQGSSAAGLNLIMNKVNLNLISDSEKDELIKAHIMPVARVKEAKLAAALGAASMEDISDGLAADLRHICEQSKTGARVYLSKIPINDSVRKISKALTGSEYELALNGGEDYELVLTAPESKVNQIADEILKICKTPVSVIGEIVADTENISIIEEDGSSKKLSFYGFNHFKDM
ncbi:MAG: thiamine-phosphate kinase [Actinobacteria bacterium]|nr:thiamine-phosphate kinase [Actinomycetota bacterium]